MPLREQYLLFALALLADIAGVAQTLITNSLPSLTTILIIAVAAVPVTIGYTLWVMRWRRRQEHVTIHPLWYSLLGFITTMFFGLVFNNSIQYASKSYGKYVIGGTVIIIVISTIIGLSAAQWAKARAQQERIEGE